MTPEDRFRELFSSAARDPGPRTDWPAFLRTARRRRRIRQARIAGGAATLVLCVVAASALVGDLPGRDRPRPAEKKEVAEEGDPRRDDIPNVERRVTKSRERVEDAGLVPEPGRVAEGKPPSRGGTSGDAPIAGDDPDPGPHADEEAALCRDEPATILGTPGDDDLAGTPGPDVIAGLGGDDVIRAGGGDDYLCGGEGVDHLYGEAGKDSLLGDAGDDELDGGDGFDFLHFPSAPNGVVVDFLRNRAEGDGTDVVLRVEAAEGTPSSDDFTGDGGANLFWGGGGPDYFNAGGGGDSLWPGPGDDGVHGAGGRDLVGFHLADGSGKTGVEVDLEASRAVGEGVDLVGFVEIVYGTTGDDVISGNDKANVLNGGFGNDTISGGAGDDTISGAAGRDALDGGPGHDALDGGSDSDACTTGEETTACETTGPLETAALALGAAIAAGALRRRRRGTWG